jgi:16S rRNA (guanine966-N2)-methyltransferase
MRIIAGRAGGRGLASPRDRSIRPTPERAREALFSTVGNLTGAVVADVYAGTGAMGCEALSRGADLCYFIDESPAAIELIEENLERIEAADQGIVMEGDVVATLPMIYDDPDLWLLDPPYDSGLALKTLEAMREAECVTEDALIVLETSVDEPPLEVEGFRTEDQREYGKSRLTYYRRIPQD